MGSKEYVNMSSPLPSCSEDSLFSGDAELELGLGLSLGGGKNNAGKPKSSAFVGRILTAKDFPTTMASSAAHSTASLLFSDRVSSCVGTVSGTKRAADSVPHEGDSPTAASQVVGWPPIRAHRMNSLINKANLQRAEDKGSGESTKSKNHVSITNFNKSDVKAKTHVGFVKVNMDGVQIGRKVDLNAHTSYENLAHTIEGMFLRSTSSSTKAANQTGGEKEAATRAYRLLDGSSDFVLTYEDKEGDWMLVGDVPWRMFVSSVKRLRIMRTSEASGLAPKFQEQSKQERSRPI